MDWKMEEQIVYSTTKSIIHKINNMYDESSRKAILAGLRNSIGRPLTENENIISIFFENIPEEIVGRTGRLSWGEDAVLSALQLYALYKQGESEIKVQEESGNSMGTSLSFLRNTEDTKSADRRFNAMITSTTLEEHKNHLRHLIKLLKSREQSVNIDFALLSKDLFKIAKGYKEEVALRWARDYYRISKKGEEKDEK